MRAQECIWILNHHADTNGHRHYELACQFAQHGYQVVVIASSFHHGDHRYLFEEECHFEEICPGVSYVYLHTRPFYSNNGVRRVINMFSYCHLAKKHAAQICLKYERPEYVIGSSVHPLAWEAAFWIAKKFKAKFICEIRDFWPLSMTEIVRTNQVHPIVKFFDIIQKRAYRRADCIVTTVRYGYKYICDELGFSREKVFWIPNGIRVSDDAIEYDLPEDLDQYLSRHWCCIYVGSFVVSECIDFMISAFQQLKDRDIYFAIIGSGHEKENLERQIVELGLTKVRIFPRISKGQVSTAIKKAKCCLAAVQNLPIYRLGLSMNKLNDYLYSGVPVIFACDVDNVVQDAGGITLPYGNMEMFAEKIMQLRHMTEKQRQEIGDQCKREIYKHYDYRIIADEYIKVLERLATKGVHYAR